MSRILPNHESVVRGSCGQDRLFHAGCDCSYLVPVEWNCQVGDLSKVLSLFLLNSHFEDLALGRGVDKKFAKLFHSRDWEERLSILFLQVPIPSHVVRVYRHRQVALEQLKGIP